MKSAMPELVATGRQAIARFEWDQALEALGAADRDGGLDPDDLMLLGDALWWTGSPDEAEETFERAYGAYLHQGRKTDAALVGTRLAYLAYRRLSMSVGSGWVTRAEHLLESEPESPAHAWLALHRLIRAVLFDGDFVSAIPIADEAMAVAERTGSPEVRSLAMSFKGLSLVHQGQWQPGMELVDEAAVMAMSELADVRATSDVYCNTIAACSELADYRRAYEWTDRAERWMKEHSIGGYPGICQVHRAELTRLRGSWSEAESQARAACVELERFHLLNGIGFAYNEIGEVRRHMGDLEGAAEAFQTAYEYGHPAQPGMSLLLMDRGEVDAAYRSLHNYMEQSARAQGDTGPAPLSRGMLLPAYVEIALAAGNLDAASSSIEELEAIAAMFPGPSWEAKALSCRGAVELARGDTEAATAVLNRAWRLWLEVELPYESAQARTLLGRARLTGGDVMGAGLELKAAHAVFKRLGAERDMHRVDRLLEEAGLTPERTRETRTFMFTDIVTSTDLIGLIGDEAWEDLLEWHDRSLRECFRLHHGEEVRHTGDGFFVAFDTPGAALDCAVLIQRRLSEHRRDHGFAPWVRIGIHEAEATRQPDDFAGVGVHVAARVGDIGEREEIVVSSETLEAAGEIDYPVSEPRSVHLKGISEPILIQTVDWR